jgi:hypothetical protein
MAKEVVQPRVRWGMQGQNRRAWPLLVIVPGICSGFPRAQISASPPLVRAPAIVHSPQLRGRQRPRPYS